MSYITQDAERTLHLPPDLRQCFQHDSSQALCLPEYSIVRDFLQLPDEEKTIRLELLKFLFQFAFATRSQLKRMLELKNLRTDGLDAMLQSMMDMREVNSFYLNEYSVTGTAPADAFVLYCLDFGAVSILRHFSSGDCLSWFTTDCVRSSQVIQKYMSTVEFYLSLSAVQGEHIRYFSPLFDVTFGHREVRFSASFGLQYGCTGTDFILESVRAHDLPCNWTQKVDGRLVHFVVRESNMLHCFPPPGPVFIFLAEQESDLAEIADIFYRRTEFTRFCMTTDGQVRSGMDTAFFWNYVASPSGFPEMGSLEKTRSAILSGNL